MEKLLIFGLAAMISIFAFRGNDSWPTTNPRYVKGNPPCIDKPQGTTNSPVNSDWVLPPEEPVSRPAPCVD
jgi:hypothetical protein